MIAPVITPIAKPAKVASPRVITFTIFSKTLIATIIAKIAKAKTEKPDLVLMDVVMSGTNGYEATRAIARDDVTRHIPVIICTGRNQETDRIWGMRQGATDYLVKPINPKELLARIVDMG